MAPKVNQSRYPKRKRADVNYEIDLSIDGDLDLDADGYVSEELGEESSSSVDTTNAHQHELVCVEEDNSEFEDATFGSRRIPKKVSHKLLPFHSHNSLKAHSVKSLRSSRPGPKPRSSLPSSSSHSDSCKSSLRPSPKYSSSWPTITLKINLQISFTTWHCPQSDLY